MTLVADMRSPKLWHLWNSDYAYGTDASNEGFVIRTDGGWALHQRGRRSQASHVFGTLDEALAAAGVERRARQDPRARS